ncbi:MAG: exostosin family protein [Acidobacteriaceae bacterium]|nr:exostosin family protein [Acidobacteriaceae bacterium]
MLLHLAAVDDTELLRMLPERAKASGRHELTDDPAAAEMILLLGSFGGHQTARLLEHPLYQRFRDKVAVYTDDDHYLPLAPGVYCSAAVDESVRCGRVSNYSYVTANGQFANQFAAGASAAAERTLLFSFQGGSTSLLRKKLFNLDFGREDVFIENTSAYRHWDDSQQDRAERQRRYAETLASSSFVLCPRGAGRGSIRFFEVMRAGVAPVLLSDGYALPPGPDWDSFLIRVAEKEMKDLPKILEPLKGSAIERGCLARAAWEEYFAPEVEFDLIVERAWSALNHAPPLEEHFRRQQQSMIAAAARKEKMRAAAKSVVLWGLKTLRLKNPYQMNRSS